MKNKMKKLLGVGKTLKTTTPQSIHIGFKPQPVTPAPLPAEFKVSAFKASKINEFEEQERIKKGQQQRLIDSKKHYRFKKVKQKRLMFIDGTTQIL